MYQGVKLSQIAATYSAMVSGPNSVQSQNLMTIIKRSNLSLLPFAKLPIFASSVNFKMTKTIRSSISAASVRNSYNVNRIGSATPPVVLRKSLDTSNMQSPKHEFTGSIRPVTCPIERMKQASTSDDFCRIEENSKNASLPSFRPPANPWSGEHSNFESLASAESQVQSRTSSYSADKRTVNTERSMSPLVNFNVPPLTIHAPSHSISVATCNRREGNLIFSSQNANGAEILTLETCGNFIPAVVRKYTSPPDPITSDTLPATRIGSPEKKRVVSGSSNGMSLSWHQKAPLAPQLHPPLPQSAALPMSTLPVKSYSKCAPTAFQQRQRAQQLGDEGKEWNRSQKRFSTIPHKKIVAIEADVVGTWAPKVSRKQKYHLPPLNS